MARSVEFHEAVITLAVKVIEDGRTVDVQRFQLAVLLDTPQEWEQALGLIQQQMAALREAAKEAADGDMGNT